MREKLAIFLEGIGIGGGLAGIAVELSVNADVGAVLITIGAIFVALGSVTWKKLK